MEWNWMQFLDIALAENNSVSIFNYNEALRAPDS